MDAMEQAFSDWWFSPISTHNTEGNPCRWLPGPPAYWAWQGWQAAMRECALVRLTDTHRVLDAVLAEREACAKAVEQFTGAWDDEGYALAQAIRARGNEPKIGEVNPKIGEVNPKIGEQVTWRQALGDDPLAR